MADMSLPPHEIRMIRAADGISVALHAMLPDDPVAIVIYVHGLQSHAGWLFETAPALIARRVGVYVIDRRGCGRSEGSRGDVPSFETWLEDYEIAIAAVRAKHGRTPITLIGQSMGGSLVAGLICRDVVDVDAVLWVAPALRQSHHTPADRERIHAHADDVLEQVVRPRDEDYTDDDRYLGFLRDDPLMGRWITRRHRSAQLRMEEFCIARAGQHKHRPSGLFIPVEDPIIDLRGAREVFGRLGHGRGLVVEFPATNHYLEFSTARHAVVELYATFARTAGLSLLD